LLATQNKWPDAESALRAFLKSNPDSFEAHSLLGLVLHNEHEAKESMFEYLEAAKLGDLNSLDLKMFGLDCAMLGSLEDADKWLTRSLEMNPTDWQGWDTVGHVRFEEEHFQEAISAFEKCLKLRPMTISSETGIGLAYEASGRAEEATDAYRKAIQFQSKSAAKDYIPYLGLGRVLLGINEPVQAAQFLRKAAGIAPRNAPVHQMLGKAYSALGEPRSARPEFEMAVRLDQRNPQFHFLLAQTYRQLGLRDQAQSELEQYSLLTEKK
jgi:tetratricopeptide (TPR) repeat protein